MSEFYIGEIIKAFRLSKGMSLRELAGKAGVSPSMLSQVENNIVNPSISVLKNISTALNVPMYKFFQENALQENLVVRKGEYKTIGQAEEETQYHLLTADSSGDLECCLMDIPANSASSDKLWGHIGEEVAFVLKGEVDVYLEKNRYHLCEGDAVKIPSNIRHRWVNESSQDVRVIFSVTPPGF